MDLCLGAEAADKRRMVLLIDSERAVFTKPSGRAFTATFCTHILKFNTKAGGKTILILLGTQIDLAPGDCQSSQPRLPPESLPNIGSSQNVWHEPPEADVWWEHTVDLTSSSNSTNRA